MIYGKQKHLGCKKWCGQEKQQRLKGLISECGKGLYNRNTSLDEILSPISNIHRLNRLLQDKLKTL